eukprot:TRINITY_DN104438_c0_g1_i1.p1 TRINITY_DN104438_c0_g1~~TRINITY_DN104438_c0_g1_i1.p1  ORF type:complete len:546 (-),score=99.85 TRINITY_DN104438_c0_g1_i1:60-1697(-)
MLPPPLPGAAVPERLPLALPPAALPRSLLVKYDADGDRVLKALRPVQRLDLHHISRRESSPKADGGKHCLVSIVRHGVLHVVDQGTVAATLPLLWSRVELIPDSESSAQQSSAGALLVLRTEKGFAWIFACKDKKLKLVLEYLSNQGCIRTDTSLVLEAELAKGSCSTIYKGAYKWRDGSEGATSVAIKRLHCDRDGSALKREVEMMLRVQGHPCIVSFQGVFLSPAHQLQGQPGQGLVWSLALDFHPRGDLFDYTKLQGGLHLNKALRYLRDIASALCYLASLDIFHRDIKPENVLLREHGPAALSDFGIAVLLSDKVGLQNNLNTRSYASPEMLAGIACTASGDVFGAGCTFHFMLTVQVPFFDRCPVKMAKLKQECRLRYQLAALRSLPQAVKDLLQGMLCREPDRLTAGQLLQHPGMLTQGVEHHTYSLHLAAPASPKSCSSGSSPVASVSRFGTAGSLSPHISPQHSSRKLDSDMLQTDAFFQKRQHASNASSIGLQGLPEDAACRLRARSLGGQPVRFLRSLIKRTMSVFRDDKAARSG